VKDDEEVVIQDITEPMKMLKNCGIWCIYIGLSIRTMAVQQKLDKETVKMPELGPNDCILQYDNAPAHGTLSSRF
jgi:hypothetical protein